MPDAHASSPHAASTLLPEFDESAAAGSVLQDGAVPAGAVGIVLGSGLGGLAEAVEAPRRHPYAELPGCPVPTVVGHPGELVRGTLRGRPVVMLRGRVHAYEGHSLRAVTFGVRLLAQLGVRQLIVTNAAGGLNPHFSPGDLMVICDHLNLTGQSALAGANDDTLGPRFVDMTTAYSKDGRAAWARAAHEVGASLRHGVYAGVMGPCYETPAEVRMFRQLGGDAVGMSTVHEVAVARHRGMQVAGLSVITNMGAGMGANVLSHEEVTQAALSQRTTLCELVGRMVACW